MHWDTFDRLEVKDFQANREKVRILSGQILALEAEEYLLGKHTDEDEFD